MPEYSTISRRSAVRAAGVLASSLAVILLGGCGDDGLGKRYPVSGKITYKNAPVASASITFYPATGQTGDQRGATGVVKDGFYSLSTIGNDDGAFAGDYLVTITARNPDMTQAKENAKGGGSFRQDDVAKAFKKAEGTIPMKYESPESGKLKAKVEAKSQTINFDLTD
ncbi:MAG: hypothetical protein P4L85_11065 [Paludisphaera borealis]|uniref:hypothetical protein n=1 Tax=Paludisphaera borealis TaxID=1387353 RepID=UPI00284A33EE|nr:hypothetical protein [Paludisphaera borealis]MDR3619879.1 hypothetical protein [Paludisphaera borealis]